MATPLRSPALLLVLGCTLAACDGGHDVGRLLADAHAYYARGEDKAAIIELKNVLQQDGNNVEARALLGQAYLDAGDALSAEKELRKASALGLPRVQLMPLLGRALLLQGRFDKVLDEIRLDRSDAPQSATIAVRADAFLALGDIGQARQLYRSALSLSGQADFAPALLGLARVGAAGGHDAAALNTLERLLTAQPGDLDALRLQAQLQRRQQRTDLARQTYGQMIGLRPENLNARIDLAHLDIEEGKFAAASAGLAAARKVAPANLAIIEAQALLDFREGKNKAALAGLQQVLRGAPDHLPSLLLMGAVQLALGSPELARQAVQRVVDVEPGQVNAARLLASIEVGEGKPDAALKILAPLLENNRDDGSLLLLAGEAQLRARRYGEAAAYFERAKALHEDKAALHRSLGISALGIGDDARAIAELERAIALDGRDNQAGVMLVMTVLRTDPAKALATVNALLLKQADHPQWHNLKGGVLLVKHEPEAARISFEKALSLAPLYLPALENLTALDLAEGRETAAKQRLIASLSRDQKNAALMTMLSKLAARTGATGEARHWLEVAVKENPASTDAAMQLATAYLQAGEAQKALALAQTLQLANPADAAILALLAQAQFGAGATRSALGSYQKLAQLQAPSAALQMRLAGLQTALNDREGALASVRKALLLQKDSLETQIVLTGLLLAQGQTDEALLTARAIQAQHRDLAAGFKLEGDVWMAKNQAAAALKAYQQAFAIEKIGPLLIKIHQAMLQTGKSADADTRLHAWLNEHRDDVDTRLYFASTLLSAKAYGAAIDEYETIVRQAPDHVAALNDLAWAYFQQGDGRALATAERAYKLAPGNPAVLDTVAWIILQHGDATRALPMLQQAAAQLPDAADVHYHLGVVLMKTGDRQGARAEFERLLGSRKALPNRAEVAAALTAL